MVILPKTIYRFHSIAIEPPMAFVTETDQVILTCVWDHERPRIGHTILKRYVGGGGRGELESYFQISKCITKLQ